MNKKYIDFVPTKGVEKKETGTKVAQVRSAEVSSRKVSNTRTEVVSARSARVRSADGSVQMKKTSAMYRSLPDLPQAGARRVKRGLRADDDFGFGVIEDLNVEPVKNEVEKRPLNGNTVTKRDELKEVKSRKLIGRRLKKTGIKPVENPVEKSEEKPRIDEANKVKKSTYKMPKNPFINQEKVVKRPLSKNVYQKKVEAPAEKPSGPVAIISKPEKDKNVSLVVTIIITIILGAAAGTVAFLLLPK